MTTAKYESFLNLFRMASTHLSHLSLASTHRPSIAFLLIITTIFTVPFLAFSTSVELIPSSLPSIAYTLWDSLLGILTSSPFYFFLLNFLIVALVLSSGILNASSSHRPREFDDPQEGDLHQRGHYNYSSAVQIIHERLAFDELYGSQASSLPHLNVTESSHVYVADDGVVEHGYGDEAEDVMGKQIITDSIASFLLQRPAFSEMEGSDDALPLRAVEEESSNSSKSMRMNEIEESLVEDSTAGGDYYSQVKKISSIYSVGENGETVSLHNVCLDIHAKDIQVYDDDQRSGRDADACAEDFSDRKDGGGDVIDDASEGYHDVIGNDDGDDNGGGDDDDDDDSGGGTHIEDECDVTDEVTDAGDNQIRRTPTQGSIADTMKYQQHESVLLIEQRQDHFSLSKSSPSNSVYTQKGKAEQEGDEVLLSMSAEELNERASAFITNFRKKLISTAID